jgi:hypothetical protein
LEGVDTVLVPSGGKAGMNPLDLNQALRLFDVAAGYGGEAVRAHVRTALVVLAVDRPRRVLPLDREHRGSASKSGSSSVPTKSWRRGARCLVFPLIHDWYVFDTKTQTVEMKGSDNSRQDDALDFKTRDGNDVSVDVTVLYHVDPARRRTCCATSRRRRRGAHRSSCARCRARSRGTR